VTAPGAARGSGCPGTAARREAEFRGGRAPARRHLESSLASPLPLPLSLLFRIKTFVAVVAGGGEKKAQR